MSVLRLSIVSTSPIIISWIIFIALIFLSLLLLVLENIYKDTTATSTSFFAWNLDLLLVGSSGLVSCGFWVKNFYNVRLMFQFLNKYQTTFQIVPTTFTVSKFFVGIYIVAFFVVNLYDCLTFTQFFRDPRRLLLLVYYFLRVVVISIDLCVFVILTKVAKCFEAANSQILNQYDTTMKQPSSEGTKWIAKVRSASARNLHQILCKHYLLCDIIEDCSSLFGFPVLIGVMCCVVLIIAKLFFFWEYVYENMYRNIHNTICVGLWPLLLICRLFLITWTCEMVTDEAKRTGIILHKIRSPTMDAETKEEIQFFSSQLLHRRIGFTACGFFSLDFTLLCSIAGAVTTYLVILIQFQTSNPPSTTPATTYTQWMNMTTTPFE